MYGVSFRGLASNLRMQIRSDRIRFRHENIRIALLAVTHNGAVAVGFIDRNISRVDTGSKVTVRDFLTRSKYIY